MNAPRPRGRAFKMSEPDLVAAISAWREAYETDPRVTHYTIADAIGVSQPTVSKRARLLGWVVSDAVARARNAGRTKAGGGGKALYFAARGQAPTRFHVEACAPTSIWQFARGASTTTVRHGGRHVEVMA